MVRDSAEADEPHTLIRPNVPKMYPAATLGWREMADSNLRGGGPNLTVDGTTFEVLFSLKPLAR